MRILMVNRALPIHVAGGLERHFEDLAVGLARQNHTVTLLTAALPAAVAAAERKRLFEQGIDLHELKGAPAARYSLAWMRQAPRAIEQICFEQPIDVIHAQEFAAGFWRGMAKATPLVLTVHGTLTSETPLHRDVYPLLPAGARAGAWLRYGRRFLFAKPWRRALEGAARILVDSEYTQGELQRLYPGSAAKLRVVPLGVPWAAQPAPEHAAARAELGWDDEKNGNAGTPRLLTLGRLEWAKGQDLALEALAGLKHLLWHYTIAGEGSWRGRLEAMIVKHGLAERVTLLGRVELPMIRKLLAAADLFLWPERTHPAFGLVGMEAHLAGTPVLANRRGAIAEVLHDVQGDAARWLVDEPTSEAFRAKLGALLGEPEILAAARDGLRAAALARFSYERMVDATYAAYREVAGGTGE